MTSGTPACRLQSRHVRPFRHSGNSSGHHRARPLRKVVRPTAISGTRSFGFLTDFDSQYDIGSVLGEGSFSTVYVGRCKSTQQRYAVKCIKKRYQGALLDPLLVRRVHHEVDVLNHLGRSLNVVHIRAAYEDTNDVKIVMELCEGGRLVDYLAGQEPCSEDAACLLVRDMLRTVAQCHSRGVVIRDVKPDNFMFVPHSCDSEAAAGSQPGHKSASAQVPGSLKMIDFGLATYLRPGQMLRDRVGTVHYVAPEVLRQSYGFSCDVWSVGVVAYLILAGRLPFIPEDDDTGGRGMAAPYDYRGGPQPAYKVIFRAVLYWDLDFTHPPWDRISPEAKELVQSLLARDPKQRPTAVEALQHRWFQAEAAASKDRLLLTDTLVQRLQRFGTYGRLKQAALKQVAGLLADQLVSSAGAASLLQRDGLLAAVAGAAASAPAASQGAASGEGEGRVPLRQLEEVLRSGGYELREEEVGALLEGLEVDAKGMVDPQEWVAALVDWGAVQASLGQGWDGWVQEVFERFDMDKSGFLEARDLSRVLCGEEELCEVLDTVPAAFREAAVTSPSEGPSGSGIDLDGFSALVSVNSDADNLDMFDSRRRVGPEVPL